MPVFVINLERSRHRREYMLNYLAGHGIEARIFPAVDGANLMSRRCSAKASMMTLSHIRNSAVRYLRTEIACTLSHLNIYRKIVDENIPMAMVLEDDAMFVPGNRRSTQWRPV